MCLGLNYIHRKNIWHRDMKTMNIFLTKDYDIKIGDWGVAKVLINTSHAHTFIGTPYYLSPELCLDKPYDEKSDVWALGVIWYEMIMWKHPFEANTQVAWYHKIINEGYIDISQEYSEDWRKMVRWLLEKSATKRPRMNEIVNMGVFKFYQKMLKVNDDNDWRNFNYNKFSTSKNGFGMNIVEGVKKKYIKNTSVGRETGKAEKAEDKIKKIKISAIEMNYKRYKNGEKEREKDKETKEQVDRNANVNVNANANAVNAVNANANANAMLKKNLNTSVNKGNEDKKVNITSLLKENPLEILKYFKSNAKSTSKEKKKKIIVPHSKNLKSNRSNHNIKGVNINIPNKKQTQSQSYNDDSLHNNDNTQCIRDDEQDYYDNKQPQADTSFGYEAYHHNHIKDKSSIWKQIRAMPTLLLNWKTKLQKQSNDLLFTLTPNEIKNSPNSNSSTMTMLNVKESVDIIKDGINVNKSTKEFYAETMELRRLRQVNLEKYMEYKNEMIKYSRDGINYYQNVTDIYKEIEKNNADVDEVTRRIDEYLRTNIPEKYKEFNSAFINYIYFEIEWRNIDKQINQRAKIKIM